MTIEITEFRCPTCGHRLGEEQYIHACREQDRIIDERVRERDALKDEQHRQEIQRLNKEHESEIKIRVQQILSEERPAIESRYEQYTEEKIYQAVAKNEAKHAQKDKEVEITNRRLLAQNKQFADQVEKQQTEIKKLADQVEKQQKIIDGRSSELRGTAGEGTLLDNLQNAFPKDEFTPKIVGVAMADVIQTVMIENGQKVTPAIVWDRKTSDKVTAADICKAKKYMTTHNTDYSIIVTEKGITTKDSHNTVFGMREGIYLVHPTAVIDIARIFRSFIIDKAKQISSNIDRTSKQARLYEYLKSSEYGRTIKTERELKMKLDELQRKEEKYHKETLWRNRTEIIQAWSRIVEQNQKKIDDVMRDQTNEDSKDDSNI